MLEPVWKWGKLRFVTKVGNHNQLQWSLTLFFRRSLLCLVIDFLVNVDKGGKKKLLFCFEKQKSKMTQINQIYHFHHWIITKKINMEQQTWCSTLGESHNLLRFGWRESKSFCRDETALFLGKILQNRLRANMNRGKNMSAEKLSVTTIWRTRNIWWLRWAFRDSSRVETQDASKWEMDSC